MCGRFTARNPNEIKSQWPMLNIVDDLSPRYNVAPTQGVAVALNDGSNGVIKARWGLIPSWAKSIETQKIQPINAKLETVAESRLFAPLVKRKRCIVFADGFYEWKTNGKRKTPIHFRLTSGKYFAFAGFYDIWHDQLLSCTLLTGKPNELVAPIHDRMPVMLNPDNAMKWIHPGEASLEEFMPILTPYPAKLMQAHEASPLMNKVSYDQAEALNSA